MCSFLLQRYAIDEDSSSFKVTSFESKPKEAEDPSTIAKSSNSDAVDVSQAMTDTLATTDRRQDNMGANAPNVEAPAYDLAKRLSCKWTSGVGPRIGCVRDYPTNLQYQALEQVNLSPRVTPGSTRKPAPIPSPRPSPKILVSPRLAYMGMPSPRVPVAAT